MLFDKPLFRPEAVRQALQAFVLPPSAEAARPKLAEWAAMLGTKAIEKKKETELLPGFLTDVFEGVLGYVGYPNPNATIKREALSLTQGLKADAAFGRFGSGDDKYVAVLEGKGPKDPLDRPFAGRAMSAVQQAAQYAIQLKVDWYLVTNLREIRLYHKGHDTGSYERFETAKLATDDAEFARFVFLLGANQVLRDSGNHLDALLTRSKEIGKELTNKFYHEYKELRHNTFAALKEHNKSHDPAKLLAATQKILDRVLFIAFCEDRGLVPANTIETAYKEKSTFTKRQTWQNFLGLFDAVDKGNDEAGIAPYNGGLFKRDDPGPDFIESLSVPHDICNGFLQLAAWEYGVNDGSSEKGFIDVEILGHIFEQSISDLEEMQREASGAAAEVVKKASPTKRKKEGAFYTPDFITRYIVEQTLGAVVDERFEAYRARAHAAAKNGAKALFENPRAYDLADLTAKQRDTLAAFWSGWIDELHTIRVCDPSCGSGAFLIEAFDHFAKLYRDAQKHTQELGRAFPFDLPRDILTHNLYGMDLNDEAVQIARLSCWVKTAEKGKVLTTLDGNIKRGNSLVAEPGPLSAWRERFPAAFADGGFDCVIGNPPYVRQEWIKDDKPFLQKHYKAFDGVADLYVYFYELGLNVLKPGGRLGFIVTNKWMKAGYGEALRKLYGEEAWVEQVVDFGHAKQIFPDADVFPCILVAQKPKPETVPTEPRVCVIPREQLRIDDLSRQIADEGVPVPRERFGPGPWNLEPPGVASLMEKIKAKGVPLNEMFSTKVYRGITTGLNEAFLIDSVLRNKLINIDPGCDSIIRPSIRGQDIDRWQNSRQETWMIVLKSSGDAKWPWSDAKSNAEKVFRETYPSVFAHLNSFREAAIRRQDQGQFWWESRACAFWDLFLKPKIWFQQIQYHPSYSYSEVEMYGNNKTTFLPSSDLESVRKVGLAQLGARHQDSRFDRI